MTAFNTAADDFQNALEALKAAVPDLLGKRVSYAIDNTWSHSRGMTGEGTVIRINRAPRKLLEVTVTVQVNPQGGAVLVEPHMLRVIGT